MVSPCQKHCVSPDVDVTLLNLKFKKTVKKKKEKKKSARNLKNFYNYCKSIENPKLSNLLKLLSYCRLNFISLSNVVTLLMISLYPVDT